VFDFRHARTVPITLTMRAIIKNLRRDDGFTLVELLVAMAAMLIVAGGAMTVLISLQRNAAADVERAHAIREAEQGLLRMTKDLREANAVSTRGANEITVDARIQGVDYTVRYNCAEAHPTLANVFQCARYATTGGSTQREVVVERVLNDEPVFRYPNDGRLSYVRARIAVPAKGARKDGYTHKVVLDDGIYMRNCDVNC
jgi:prepilin-type N-terminal cleavage/methylation domain-containing protein